jgi:hypothetical protein
LKNIVYITYEELTGNKPIISDLLSVVQKFRRRDLVIVLARLNLLVSIGTTAQALATDRQLCNLVFRVHHLAVENLRLRYEYRVVFNRLSLLFLLKQVLLTGIDDAAPFTENDIEQVGLLCLMSNDLLIPRRPERTDTLLETLHNFMLFSDYFPRDFYIRDCARTAIMMEVSQQLCKEGVKPCLHLAAEFCARFGLPFNTFVALTWGAYSHYIKLSSDSLASIPEQFEMRPDYYRRTSVSEEHIVNFFKVVSRGLDEFRTLLELRNSRADDDWTVLHQYPMIQTPEKTLVPVDPIFLIDKAGRGFYWTLFQAMDNQGRHLLAEFWGKVFERYINDQIQANYAAGGQLIPNPTFADGSEACDVCLKEGTNLILFEHKSSVLKVEKYGSDPSNLKHDLDIKFVEGEPDSPKGVAQFERTIQRFLAGDLISGIAPGQVSKIYPVMLCLEASMVAPLMTKYLNGQFAKARLAKKYKKTITPLFVIAVHHFEEFLPHLQILRMVDLLESYYAGDKQLRLPMTVSTTSVLRTENRGIDRLGDRLRQIGEQITGDLFPNGEIEDSE